MPEAERDGGKPVDRSDPTITDVTDDACLEAPPEPGAIGARLVDLGEVARGGMSTIRRVRDKTMLRDVALKLLDGPLARDPRWSRLFVDEARITGQLEHPNIVPVHDLGIDSAGKPWFTMKLVRGTGFDAWLADPARPPGSPERLAEGLEIFGKVCDAISFAHSRGVVHRDLKPANVMVGEFGQVYVMDWGLARVLGPGVEVDRSAEAKSAAEKDMVTGTVGFMSPEQATGIPEACDERTDVFGLGALLYAIVTGKSPYPGTDLSARLDAVRRGAYVPVGEALGPVLVPRRIIQIIDKAMAKRPEDRHGTTAALKADVQRFVRVGLHLPSRAYPAGSIVVREGEPGDSAFIIVRGRCVAWKTIAGERHVLREMGPGDVFGEMAVLTDLPRSASVEALEPVVLLVVGRATLDEEIGLDSWIGALFKVLVARFRELEARDRHDG